MAWRLLVSQRWVGAMAAGGTGAALAAAAPRQAHCWHPTAESACCMLALGALQLGLATRWALNPAALANDFGSLVPTDPEPESEPAQASVFSEHVDMDSKRMYYCNVATREVVWELPPGAIVQDERHDGHQPYQQSDADQATRT